MKNFTLISSLLREPWLIEPGFATANLPLVQNLFAGNNLPATDLPAEPLQVAFSQSGAESRSSGAYDAAGTNSVAVIDITGPVMKYDSCSSYGTQSYSRMIQQAMDHPNISAIVLRMDTPGGQVSGTASLADTIANRTKPVIVHVTDGILASAGVWIAAPADEIYTTQATDQVGSIGVYTTLVNPKGQYEAMGIEVLEIYADGSEDKNGAYRSALAGDVSGIKEGINFIREQFVATVQKHRPQVKAEAFTGKMYHTKQAKAMGLIDGQKSFQEVVNRAAALSTNYKKPNSNQAKADTTQTEMFSFLPKNVAALAGLDSAAITDEQLAAANSDFQSKVNDGLEIVQAGAIEALQSELAHANGELENATETITSLTTERDQAQADLATANETISRLNNERATAGATHVQPATDTIATTKELSTWEKKAQRLK